MIVNVPAEVDWFTQFERALKVEQLVVFRIIAWMPEPDKIQLLDVTWNEACVAEATKDTQELFSIDPQKSPLPVEPIAALSGVYQPLVLPQ